MRQCRSCRGHAADEAAGQERVRAARGGRWEVGGERQEVASVEAVWWWQAEQAARQAAPAAAPAAPAGQAGQAGKVPRMGTQMAGVVEKSARLPLPPAPCPLGGPSLYLRRPPRRSGSHTGRAPMRGRPPLGS